MDIIPQPGACRRKKHVNFARIALSGDLGYNLAVMLKKVFITVWKFFLGGEGMSFRTGRYFGEAMLVGAVTGFVVVADRKAHV